MFLFHFTVKYVSAATRQSSIKLNFKSRAMFLFPEKYRFKTMFCLKSILADGYLIPSLFFLNMLVFLFLLHIFLLLLNIFHCKKSVRVHGFPGPYFPAFELNTKTYSVNLSVQSKKILENQLEKYGPVKTVNSDIFYAIFLCLFPCNKSISKNLNGNKTIKERNECKAKLRDEFNEALSIYHLTQLPLLFFFFLKIFNLSKVVTINRVIGSRFIYLGVHLKIKTKSS